MPELVGRNPLEALSRIERRFGAAPTQSGDNNDGIVAIRDLIRDYSAGLGLYAGLMITAPHTHWDSPFPLLISFNDERYFAKEAEPHADKTYRAVSFALSDAGPLAYEWVDESVSMDDGELDMLWRCVHWLAPKMHGHAWPLGIGLNYRFKRLLDPVLVNTSEYQFGTDLDSPAVIVRPEDFPDTQDAVAMEQVAWHSASGTKLQLDPLETSLFDEVKTHLTGLSGNARAQWLAWLFATANQ